MPTEWIISDWGMFGVWFSMAVIWVITIIFAYVLGHIQGQKSTIKCQLCRKQHDVEDHDNLLQEWG